MVYEYSVLPLVAHIFTPGGRATCFAYGQTGSGKTYTMSGVQLNAARDIFRLMRSPEHADKDLSIYTAFFEIYGGRCFDVLHGRSKVVIREDGRGNVQAVGLRHVPCASEEELLAIIEEGNASRTTKKTHMNDASSRSHAVCEILVKDGRGRVFGKMSLIDLAGSERAADARHHDRQRRVESAGINKSLLALKECIRCVSHVLWRCQHPQPTSPPLLQCTGLLGIPRALPRLQADHGAEGQLHSQAGPRGNDRHCLALLHLSRPHHQHAAVR